MARIFLLKTLVTFLIATPSPVWLFVAALKSIRSANAVMGSRAIGRRGLLALPNNSVSSLTKLFGHIVAFIDDEILVEDLEDLSALKICHVESMLVSIDGWACE